MLLWCFSACYLDCREQHTPPRPRTKRGDLRRVGESGIWTGGGLQQKKKNLRHLMRKRTSMWSDVSPVSFVISHLVRAWHLSHFRTGCISLFRQWLSMDLLFWKFSVEIAVSRQIVGEKAADHIFGDAPFFASAYHSELLANSCTGGHQVAESSNTRLPSLTRLKLTSK